tara:strand:- start:2424 stop:3476 length:1053 start_codon:yes stop_codon:yes gene_type:complete
MRIAKPILGIIGGGQLGSMLASAAKKIDIKTVIVSDDEKAPAKNFCDKFIFTKYNDNNKINEFIQESEFITFEFENIPYEILKKINHKKPVLPHPDINKIVQNRFKEKNFLNKLGIKTTKFSLIEKKRDLLNNENLLPGILKTCTLGYDGKGQYEINSSNELENLNIDFNNKYILEKKITLKKEISIIITRFKNNTFQIYEPIENIHQDQILKNSKIPAQINQLIYEQSVSWAKKISEKLNFIGTLCVEYFIDNNDVLYVNEIAPRVHNSGHLTINAYNISQFENHIRAVCQLDQVELKKISNAEMINILGEEIIKYRDKKFSKNEFFYDYLKETIRNKRKMGHLTILKD